MCLGAWFPIALRCSTPSDDCLYDAECKRAGLPLCLYDAQMELFTCEPVSICE